MKNRSRPQAEILTIGDELLKGSTLNSNARFLGRELTGLGFRVMGQTSCPDDLPLICARLGECLSRAEVVVLTGGLGPTPDDVTREALAEYFQVPLEFSKSQYRQIEKFYKTRGKKVPGIVRKEAEFPANAVPLVNRYGIALGFYIPLVRQLVIVLPGVPREQENMFRDLVRPVLLKRYPKISAKYSLTIKTTGLSEPDVMRRLGKTFFRDAFDFGIYPSPGEAALRLQAEKKEIVQRLRTLAEKRLGPHVYAWEDLSLSEAIGKILTKKSLTLSLAESCTGGALAAEITQAAGASTYFPGGVVTYSNVSKIRELGVSPAVLYKHGAVSEAVVKAMASGVRKKFGASLGIGITGIAGPSGGTREKAVGTVWMALASASSVKAWRYSFSGERTLVQVKSVRKALEHLWHFLQKPEKKKSPRRA